METKLVPIGSIKRYTNNPRRNDHAVATVAQSLKDFGFRQPIVVDKHMVIVVGDTRYMAAQKLGLAKVPIHVAHDLSEDKIKAYRIADNKTGEVSQWDNEKLLVELNALVDTNIDFTKLGFSEEELKNLMSDAYVAREMEDFEKSPVEGNRWILIRAPESQAALIMNSIKKLKLKDAHVEYTGDKK